MKAVILESPGRFNLAEMETPAAPAPGEALVRVRRVGICGTDIHAFRGEQPFFSYPRIMGHELGVEIVAIGENDHGLAVGDRCTVEPYIYCDHCIACRRGKTNCCVDMQVLGVHLDGGMREFMTVPIEKLYKSEILSFDQLAMVEMLTIGAHAVRRAQPEPGENVLVIGTGPIGMSVTQFAKLAGANVVIMDISPQRLAFCRQQLGIERYLDGSEDPVRALENMLGGDLPTIVFDATGNPQSMMNAFDYMAHGGKLVFVGLAQADITFHDPDFHRRETTLLSSRNATSEDFKRVIRALEDEGVDTTPWITHRASLEELIDRFPQWLEPGSGLVKAMVEI
ncbi:MAG: zinc-binding alcohol dehydrogenase family protein [Anaerolineae bacterium]|nr:zinc-binding alcohol dehydrogenase family protein [Anaerolineae bacterium]